VKPGDTVAVVGDSAVGLCGVLAARRQGAERIIALSRHLDRQQLGREFGATDIVEARGEEAIGAVIELTDGVGVDVVLECVGTGQAMDTALGVVRPGSMVGYVGVPHGVELPVPSMFYGNRGVLGGPAPARAYLPELLDDVLEGRIKPGRVFASRPIWTASQRHARPWTNAARSSRSCGSGRCERRGGPVEVIRPGNRVFFDPARKTRSRRPDRRIDSEQRHRRRRTRSDRPSNRAAVGVGKHVLLADLRQDNANAAAEVLGNAGYGTWPGATTDARLRLVSDPGHLQ
jgi:Zinc-binding dehydrogenase